MKKSYPLVDIHYALWVVLTVPLGFAGVFSFMGLLLVQGLALEAAAGIILFYIMNLTRLRRAAWLLGMVLHTVLLFGSAYASANVLSVPLAFSLPFAALNLYSLLVLLFHRQLWSGELAAREDALLA